MGISIYITGIIIGGLLAIVSLVFTILSLTGGKIQRAIVWAAGLVISIFVTVVSIVHVVHRLEGKFKNMMGWSQEYSTTTGNYHASDYDDQQKSARQAFLDTLQFYVNENLKNKIPVDFYLNRKVDTTKNGQLNLPFIYPLSIYYHPDNFLGDIANDATDSVFITNISQMAFDQNFMIAIADNTNDKIALKEGRTATEYILFDLRTHEYLTFKSLQELLDKSDKIGYSGSSQLNYLSDDYRGWADTEGYD